MTVKMSDLNPFKKQADPVPEQTAATPAPEPEPVKTYKNQLTITYKSGCEQKVWINNWTGEKNLDPWKGFHQWWFKRESPSYWIEVGNGGFMVLREDVLRFQVEVSEEKPKKEKK